MRGGEREEKIRKTKYIIDNFYDTILQEWNLVLVDLINLFKKRGRGGEKIREMYILCYKRGEFGIDRSEEINCCKISRSFG